MSDKTFRQVVEEILFQLYGNMEPCESCSERGECTKTPIQCALDRICDAVLKMAEGMPKRPTILIHISNDRFLVPTLETRKQLQQIEDAEKEYLSECQAYIRKQVE